MQNDLLSNDVKSEKLKINISDINLLVKKKLLDHQKNYAINGFRKGKVPFNILEKTFGYSFYEKIIQEKINNTLRSYFNENKIHPLFNPSIINSNIDGDILNLEFTYIEMPDVNFNCCVNKEITSYVVDDQVDFNSEEFVNLCIEHFGENISLKSKVKNYDLVELEYSINNLDDNNNYCHNIKKKVVLNSGNLCMQLENKLINNSINEKTQFIIKNDESCKIEELRNKNVQWTISVISISRLIYNDQLISISDIGSYDEFVELIQEIFKSQFQLYNSAFTLLQIANIVLNDSNIKLPQKLFDINIYEYKLKNNIDSSVELNDSIKNKLLNTTKVQFIKDAYKLKYGINIDTKTFKKNLLKSLPDEDSDDNNILNNDQLVNSMKKFAVINSIVYSLYKNVKIINENISVKDCFTKYNEAFIGSI